LSIICGLQDSKFSFLKKFINRTILDLKLGTLNLVNQYQFCSLILPVYNAISFLVTQHSYTVSAPIGSTVADKKIRFFHAISALVDLRAFLRSFNRKWNTFS